MGLWADIADEEDEGLGLPADSLLCDHRNHRFPTRNALCSHLRALGRVHDGLTLRFAVNLLSITDEYRRMGPAESVDQVQGGPMESKLPTAVLKNRRLRRHESAYDVCEVFSPARVTEQARKRGLGGGLGPRRCS